MKSLKIGGVLCVFYLAFKSCFSTGDGGVKYLSTDTIYKIVSLAESVLSFEVVRMSGQNLVSQVVNVGFLNDLLLKSILRSLSQPEMVELVAVMFIGRGDYISSSNSKEQIRQAFRMHVEELSSKHKIYLEKICSGNGFLFCYYVGRGLRKFNYSGLL